MAIIPRAPLQVRDIGLLPQVRNTTRVEAATGMAVAVDWVVSAGADIIQERADRADTAAVMDAQQQLSAWQNDWFDPDNDKGIRKYQGVNALKLSDTMVSDFQRRASEIEARMPSRRAKEKFREYAGVELQQVRSRVNAYAVHETDAAEAAMRSAFEEARRNDMIGALVEGDEQRAATTWATTVDLIHANAAASGRPAACADAGESQYQSRLTRLPAPTSRGPLPTQSGHSVYTSAC